MLSPSMVVSQVGGWSMVIGRLLTPKVALDDAQRVVQSIIERKESQA
jgi:hypothetical protein